MRRPPRQQVDYGLDAPGVMLWNAVGALAYLALGIFFLLTGSKLRPLLCFFGGGLIWLASPVLMLLSSRVGKLRQRDVILRQIGLRGNEEVLDVGTGHGLMLIGAAKLVPQGRAVGVDIWQQGDQGDNSRANTLRNVELEGVSANCTVEDGDARQLPFADASFDIVLANFALHNIPGAAGKQQACREIARVLKPGGRVFDYDMFFTTGPFVTYFRVAGLAVSAGPLQWRTFPPGILLVGRKP
jgi:SAM-dependent methyltransferase